MLLIIGIIVVLFGVASILYGDKELNVGGGLILRVFAWPSGRARRLKLVMGAALIVAGVVIIVHAVGGT
jgi:hypothetical protein